jgi:hypothetical protein
MNRIFGALVMVALVSGCGNDGDATPDASGNGQQPDATATDAAPLDAAPPQLDCPAFPPCGGDPTGVWMFEQMCAGPVDGECPGTSFDFSEVEYSGTITFGADMAYAVNLTTSGSFVITQPLSCLQGTSCEEMSVDGSTCATVGDTCRCEHSFEPGEGDQENGTWSTAETTVTMTPTGEGEDTLTATYCVEGDTLKMKVSDAQGGTTISLTR